MVGKLEFANGGGGRTMEKLVLCKSTGDELWGEGGSVI